MSATEVMDGELLFRALREAICGEISCDELMSCMACQRAGEAAVAAVRKEKLRTVSRNVPPEWFDSKATGGQS